ncbi:hypothetical protein FRX31_008600 [Thalictrum thalictroides]|uniref:Uncharacterized protein n=1 Tax=Thalictrum thalictroides TaxID=46969 RepID=A0A7J6WXM8_THATH|nr:hypothetical protein FRX31_008600 [Thalictrum thalictroides]
MGESIDGACNGGGVMGSYGIHSPKGLNDNNGTLMAMIQSIQIQFGSIGKHGKSTWAEVLGKKPSSKGLQYIPPTLVNGEPVIHVELKHFEHLQSKFENIVVGSFIGK